jgi:hypothetical protein
MNAYQFLSNIVDPGLAWTKRCTGIVCPPALRPILLAIALQESDLHSRFQVLQGGAPGAARGWWQFEQPTIGLLMEHPKAASAMRGACEEAVVKFDAAAIWRAIEGHDMLSVAVARVLIWTDPQVLPADEDSTWEMYNKRLWRPGKPNRDRWKESWMIAKEIIG